MKDVLLQATEGAAATSTWRQRLLRSAAKVRHLQLLARMQMIKVGNTAVMIVQFIRVCKNVSSEYTLDLVADKLHDAAEAGSRVLLKLGPLLSGRLLSLRYPHDVHM